MYVLHSVCASPAVVRGSCLNKLTPVRFTTSEAALAATHDGRSSKLCFNYTIEVTFTVRHFLSSPTTMVSS